MPPASAPPIYLGSLFGLVFDLDGTLISSDHDFLRMRREVVRISERYGVTPGRLSVQEPIPKLMEAALSELSLGGVPEGVRFRFEGEVNDTIDAIELEALPKTRVRPGAGPLLEALRARDYRLGILTRSSERFCRAALDRTRLRGYFANLRTRSSPGPAKPSPESLLHLLKDMGVPMDRAMFVGDHPLDAECATRARVRFIGILPEGGGAPELGDRLKSAGALQVVPDLPALGRSLGIGVPPVAPTTAAYR